MNEDMQSNVQKGYIPRSELEKSKGNGNLEKPFPKVENEMAEMYTDRVLIRLEKADEKTPGGIIIPDTVKERPRKGMVISVGPGTDKDNPMKIQLGAIIVFSKYAGIEFKVQDVHYVVLRESDIMFRPFEPEKFRIDFV